MRCFLVPGALIVALVVAGGCSESSDDATSTTEADGRIVVRQTLTLSVDAPSAELAEAAAVVEARLEVVGVDGVVEVSDGTVEIDIDAMDEGLARAALSPVGVLEFRPVLAADVDDELTDSTHVAPDGEAVLAGVAVLADGGSRYLLGPAAVVTDGVESVEAVEMPGAGSWVLQVVLREGLVGIDGFNAAADRCYTALPSCPSLTSDGTPGQLAIVLDGVVISTPTVQTNRFERDQISISGDFDEDSARGLAVALNHPAPVHWVLDD